MAYTPRPFTASAMFVGRHRAAAVAEDGGDFAVEGHARAGLGLLRRPPPRPRCVRTAYRCARELAPQSAEARP